MTAFDSFFSFYRKSVKGVHGTAIFTKRDVVVPAKAEEGIGSSLLPSTMPVDERIGGYPLSSDADLDYNTMKDLDSEGRTTVIDTGMFVLINLCALDCLLPPPLYLLKLVSLISPRSRSYCPNETNSDRLEFKLNFNKMVDRRVRGLIRAGRQVIVVGDLVRPLPPSVSRPPLLPPRPTLIDSFLWNRTSARPTSTPPTQSAVLASRASRRSPTTRRAPGSTALPARTAS